MLFNPKTKFALAREFHSTRGAPLGDVFSFVSGLYFRGKKTYAEAFGRPPEGLGGGLVISPSEGLRFLHEPVTVERLRAWATVDIDEKNPSFTRPLLAHLKLLDQVHGAATRFVLLGSIASDKYVRPLTSVLGERLLFPPDFVGRGDMSRGALLLRAARAGQELRYAPLSESKRHGPRAQPLGRARRSAPEVVILVGLPGSGKSTFFRQRFAETHIHVSKDNFKNNPKPARRQSLLTIEALKTGRSLVLDNTNASVEERASTIAEARAHGARVIGYFFDCTVKECVTRNAGREGRARIPNVGIYATAKRLVRPMHDEGFDELYVVRPLPEHGFEIARDDPSAPIDG